MVGKRKSEQEPQETTQAAPPLPAETQPAGSGATPGTGEQTFGERLKAGAEGEQVAPGVNDGTDKEPMVTYHGEFSRREISKEDWERAGIADMPAVVWDRATGHKVPKSVFTDQALQVLRQDSGFQVP